MKWVFVSLPTICHISPLCHSFIATLQLGLLECHNSTRKCWNKLVLLIMRFVLSFIKVFKMPRLFVKTKTFSPRPRSRPRLSFQDQDHFSCPWSASRLETKTKVSRLYPCILETFPKPISWLGMEKLNVTQQKHAFTNKKCIPTQTKHKKIKPGLVASYNIRPGNGEGLILFWHFINLSLTYLLRHLPTYLQPQDPHRADGREGGRVGWGLTVLLTQVRSYCACVITVPCT